MRSVLEAMKRIEDMIHTCVQDSLNEGITNLAALKINIEGQELFVVGFKSKETATLGGKDVGCFQPICLGFSDSFLLKYVRPAIASALDIANDDVLVSSGKDADDGLKNFIENVKKAH